MTQLVNAAITLSTWFTSEYQKSGKKLHMGKGRVSFKSLENLALNSAK